VYPDPHVFFALGLVYACELRCYYLKTESPVCVASFAYGGYAQVYGLHVEIEFLFPTGVFGKFTLVEDDPESVFTISE
jgi:hypothetical protein